MRKSRFFQQEVTYLGMSIFKEGVRPIAEGKFELAKLTPVKTKKQLQRLLGVINWYRSFIMNLSSIVSPLTYLLKTETVIEWTTQLQELGKNPRNSEL